MKRLITIAGAISVCLLLSMPVLAEQKEADVIMEGKTYHLVLESIDIIDDKLTIEITGFGDTLHFGPTGPMLAGMPEAHYGDEIVNTSNVHVNVGAASTFSFERDSFPDSIWMKSYDKDAELSLIWQADANSNDVTEIDDMAVEEDIPDSAEAVEKSEEEKLINDLLTALSDESYRTIYDAIVIRN